MSTFYVFYFAFALLVGLLGIGRFGGFLLYFFLSLIITPLLTLLILAIITPKPKSRRA
jgi:hypothetical protein